MIFLEKRSEKKTSVFFAEFALSFELLKVFQTHLKRCFKIFHCTHSYNYFWYPILRVKQNKKGNTEKNL